MNEREHLQRHLPPGASCGHEVLFDFDGVFAALAPTPDQLVACVRDLLPILARAPIAAALYADGHDATELALALLATAHEQGTPLPNGPEAHALHAELRRLDRVSDGCDALKRLLGIQHFLELAANRPPPAT